MNFGQSYEIWLELWKWYKCLNEQYIVKCAKSAFYWSGYSGESVNSGESDGARKISVSGESVDCSQSGHSDETGDSGKSDDSGNSGETCQSGESCDSGDYRWFWWIW